MVWEKNLRLVHKHNEETSAGQHSFAMGVNHLTDMVFNSIHVHSVAKHAGVSR